MSLRTEWKFKFPASVLKEAADDRAEHHRERKTHWQGIRDAKKAEYRASLEKSVEKATDREALIEAALSVSNKMSSSRVTQAQIQGDDEVFYELQEALQKVEQHHDQIVGYELWAKLFEREDPDRQFKLDFSDAVHFEL